MNRFAKKRTTFCTTIKFSDENVVSKKILIIELYTNKISICDPFFVQPNKCRIMKTGSKNPDFATTTKILAPAGHLEEFVVRTTENSR